MGQRALPASEASDALQPHAVPLFADSPFAQRPECSGITAIATDLNMRQTFAQRLEQLEVTDEDLPCFALMRPKMIEDLLHLPHALALRFAISCGEVFKEEDEENVSQHGDDDE